MKTKTKKTKQTKATKAAKTPKAKAATKPATKGAKPPELVLTNETPAAMPVDIGRHLARDYHPEFNLALLAPPANNARTEFDPAKMAELEASIRTHGVQTPLWVRKLREATKAGATHVIFGGERRWRAAKAAGLLTVPVFDYGKISEAAADELADLENCQRENLNAAERALAYARMVKDHGWAWWDEKETSRSLAHRLNLGSKTKAYEWARIARAPRLLLEALGSGEVSMSVAVQLSRIGSEKAMLAAAGAAVERKMTDKEVGKMIEKDYLTELKGAPFNTEDAELVKAAGSCAACPWRSGNQMDLAPEFRRRGDICTRPECYRDKCRAAFEVRAAAHKEAGGEVWSDAEAKRNGLGDRFTSLSYDWVSVDDTEGVYRCGGEYGKNEKPLRSVLKTELVGGKIRTALALTRDGTAQILELVRRADAEKLLRANGTIKPRSSGGGDGDAEKKRKAAVKRGRAIVDEAVAVIVMTAAAVKAGLGGLGEKLLRVAVLELASRAYDDQARRIAKRRNLAAVDFKLSNEVGWWRKALPAAVTKAAGGELSGWLAELVCSQDCGYQGDTRSVFADDAAKAMLDLLGMDGKKLLEEARETVDAAAKGKAGKAGGK